MTIQVLEVVAGLLGSLIYLVVGTSLLALARRTRKLPELLIGTSFIVAVLGNTVWVMEASLDPLSKLSLHLGVGSSSLVATSGALTAWAAWQIFRRSSTGATLLMGALLALLPAYGFSLVLISYPVGSLEHHLHPVFITGNLALMTSYGWMSFESINRWRLLRRRRRFGLPVKDELAHRLFLWGVGTATLPPALFFLALPSDAIDLWFSPRLSTSILGIVCAVCWWLAFFPPKIYSRWLRASSGGAPEKGSEAE